MSLCDYSTVPVQEDKKSDIVRMLDLRITRSCLWFNQSEIFYSGSWLWGALIKKKIFLFYKEIQMGSGAKSYTV